MQEPKTLNPDEESHEPFVRGDEAVALVNRHQITLDSYPLSVPHSDALAVELMSRGPYFAMELLPGYLLVIREEDEPSMEYFKRGIDPAPDAGDYIADLRMHLFSTADRRLAGALAAEIYNLEMMLSSYDIDEVWEHFDNHSSDRVSLFEAVRDSRVMGPRLRQCEENSIESGFCLFHLDKIGIEPDYRHRSLGTSLFDFSLKYAYFSGACDFALTLPFAPAYERGSFQYPEFDDDEDSEGGVESIAVRALTRFIKRRGFRKPGRDSEFYFRKLEFDRW